MQGLHGMYVFAISIALATGGGALGIFIGALPYFLYDASDYSRLDLFFAQSLVVGAMLGLIIGCANGTRWYHSQDLPGWVQRRLTRYLRERAQPTSQVQRAISVSYLQRLRAMQGD
ncbi:MAG TPA: hypothetical protein VJN22_06095 [Candidatus Eremiobacteraceae bacterium]|nr:hypothetical protein [Candidatus Eremiobacteraceae bacterium]